MNLRNQNSQWLSLIALVLFFKTATSQYTCPSIWNPSPCTCKDGVVTCNLSSRMHFIENFIKLFQTTSTPIKLGALKIDNSIIDILPAKIFGEFSFEEIRFANTQLKQLDTDTFKGQESLLKRLLLVNGNFTAFNYEAIKSLRNLQRVSLTENGLQEVPKEAFAGLPNLESIFLNLNQIKVVHSKAFSQLPNLKAISLSHNDITYVDAVAFNLMKVTGPISVYLNGNNINSTGLHTDAFQEGTQLKSLYLSQNKLTTLPEKVYSHIIDTMVTIPGSVLDVTNNPFKCDSSLKWLVNKPDKYKKIVQGLYCPNGKELMKLTTDDLH